jgi:hypothetical protein
MAYDRSQSFHQSRSTLGARAFAVHYDRPANEFAIAIRGNSKRLSSTFLSEANGRIVIAALFLVLDLVGANRETRADRLLRLYGRALAHSG